MIEALPPWITLLFLVICAITIFLFYIISGKSKKTIFLLLLWSVFHSILAFIGFYDNTIAMPPRFGLVLIPSLFLIVFSVVFKRDKWILERNTTLSTFLHAVRIPVEICLYGLFTHKMVPELMTFEGSNFDILFGLSAPLIGLLYLLKKLNTKTLLVWNYIGLMSVLFIFINGILSAQLPIQQFGFDQPNRAILYFPFVLLPAMIVPIVIWTHLSDIIILRRELKAKLKQ